jgi:hypothetical protein
MKTHPRELPIQKAHSEIDRAVTDAVERHPDLTYLELLSILNQIAASWIKWGIKDERTESVTWITVAGPFDEDNLVLAKDRKKRTRKPNDAIQPGEGK